LICRQQSAADSFVSGAADLWRIVRLNPALMKPLFTGGGKKLSFHDIRQLYNAVYSPLGSNRREQEDDTIYSWEVFLHRCEGLHKCLSPGPTPQYLYGVFPSLWWITLINTWFGIIVSLLDILV